MPINQMPVIENMQGSVRELVGAANEIHGQVQNAESRRYWSNVLAKLAAVQQALDSK